MQSSDSAFCLRSGAACRLSQLGSEAAHGSLEPIAEAAAGSCEIHARPAGPLFLPASQAQRSVTIWLVPISHEEAQQQHSAARSLATFRQYRHDCLLDAFYSIGDTAAIESPSR
jgi:hypothetical protein